MKAGTVAGALRWATGRLAGAGINDPRLEAEVLLAYVLGIERTQLLAELKSVLGREELTSYLAVVERRASRYPLQYITGRAEFMSLSLEVGPGVLIPRPDTEVLVEEIIDEVGEENSKVIVDVGTGCGNIAASLKYYLKKCQVYAVEVDPVALRFARRNASRLGLEIIFVQGDLLEPFLDRGPFFDVVVSNPPYIRSDLLPLLPPEVQHEPVVALNGGPDGLDVYRRLVDQARVVLKPRGILAVEIGWDQREAVTSLFARAGYVDVRVVPDLAGRDRVVAGYR